MLRRRGLAVGKAAEEEQSDVESPQYRHEKRAGGEGEALRGADKHVVDAYDQ
jgi:hypothetical protein